jgi:hypothetical protein
MICQYSLEAQANATASAGASLPCLCNRSLFGRGAQGGAGHGTGDQPDEKRTREPHAERRLVGAACGWEGSRPVKGDALMLAAAVMRWQAALTLSQHSRATSRLLKRGARDVASDEVHEETVELTFAIPVAIDVAMYSAEVSACCRSFRHACDRVRSLRGRQAQESHRGPLHLQDGGHRKTASAISRPRSASLSRYLKVEGDIPKALFAIR